MSITVLDAVVQLRRELARAAAATFTGDVSARQVSVLREIRASGPLSQVSLARATASDPSLIVRLLDDLEKRGLVRRHRSGTDRRQRVVSLTAQGRKALGPLDAAHKRLANAMQAGLTAGERAAFVATAARIRRALATIAAGGEALPERVDEQR